MKGGTTASEDRVVDRIRSFAALAPGWDSYNADSISPEIIESAVRDAPAWATLGMRYVYPTSSGGVQFEGEIGGVECEAEYIGPDTVELLLSDDDGEEIPSYSAADALALLRAKAGPSL